MPAEESHSHEHDHSHGSHGHDHGPAHEHGGDALPGPLLGGIAFASDAAREHARAHALGLPHVHPVNFDPTVPEPDPFLPTAAPGHAFRLGIGGPVGSGKTALVAALCRALAAETNLAVVTNDIYTTEDADFLKRNSVLADDRIEAVQTGTCPHTAIRDDITANLDKCDLLEARFPDLELIVIESGGDNLTAVFSQGLIDAQIFVVDVAAGDKIPRKGGPGVTTADLLVINKTDLAPYVGADLGVMESDAHLMRDDRPVILQSLIETPDAPAVAAWLRETMRAHGARPGAAATSSPTR